MPAALETVQIGFGAFALVGLWLALVGWIAKPGGILSRALMDAGSYASARSFLWNPYIVGSRSISHLYGCFAIFRMRPRLRLRTP